jgi:hypothetical protein
MRKNTVLLHGSFSPLLTTILCSIGLSTSVMLFQVARSERFHCKSPSTFPFPRSVDAERIETVVVRFTPFPELRVKVTPVVELTNPLM